METPTTTTTASKTDKAYANGYEQGLFIASNYPAATVRQSAEKARKSIKRLANRPGPSRAFEQGIVAAISDSFKAGSVK